MALRQDPISGGDDKEEEEEEADPSASEKKVCMEKFLGWVKSMETESPDVLYQPRTSEPGASSGAPSAKVQKLINFNKSLNHAYEKKTNGEVGQITGWRSMR